MKTVGSRGACVRTSVFLAALLVSAGCDTGESSSPHFKFQIINSTGTGGVSVKVAGPHFAVQVYPLPTGGGAYLNGELPGAAGEVIEFTAVHGILQTTHTCTVTAAITGTAPSDTARGEISVSDAPEGLFVSCCGGWVEVEC